MTADKRTPAVEKMARLYDADIGPVYGDRFARLVMRGLEVPARSTCLEVGARTGALTAQLLNALDEDSKLVALEDRAALLAVARGKLGKTGSRLFLRGESQLPKLPFPEDVYSLVVSHLFVGEVPDPAYAIQEMARVCEPGGEVVVTLASDGSWVQFYDILREVLTKHDDAEGLRAVSDFLAVQAQSADLERWAWDAGLESPKVTAESFDLLFKSAREFFFAPVIEYGPLPLWRSILPEPERSKQLFFEIHEAIDAYFGDRAFELSVVASRLSARKRNVDDEKAT